MKKILKIIKGGIPLGDELVTNGTFDTDTAWTKTGDTVITGGKGFVDGTTRVSLLFQNILTNGVTYRVSFDISNVVPSGTNCRIINNNGTNLFTINANGSQTFDFTHNIANGNFIFRASNTGSYRVDNVSVREIL